MKMLAGIDNAVARREKWIASIPDVFGPAEAAAAANRAYQDARASVRAVALGFGGTVPPPPWPASPELQAAMKRMRILRDGFEVFATRTPDARWPKSTGKMGPALIREGVSLFRETGKLEKAAASAPTIDDLIKRIPPPFAWWILKTSTGLVFAAGVAWIARDEIKKLFAPARRPRRRALA